MVVVLVKLTDFTFSSYGRNWFEERTTLKSREYKFFDLGKTCFHHANMPFQSKYLDFLIKFW